MFFVYFTFAKKTPLCRDVPCAICNCSSLLALAVGRVDVTDVGLFDQALVLRPFDDVFVSGDEVQQRLFVLVTVFCVCHQFLQFFDASVQRRHL